MKFFAVSGIFPVSEKGNEWWIGTKEGRKEGITTYNLVLDAVGLGPGCLDPSVVVGDD